MLTERRTGLLSRALVGRATPAENRPAPGGHVPAPPEFSMLPTKRSTSAPPPVSPPESPAGDVGRNARGKARERRAWTWNDTNLVLDFLLLVIFAAECFSAVVVRQVFPPGPAAAGWMLWGLDYDAWGGIQFGLLSALAGGILLHLMFHWSWVCAMVAGRLSRARNTRIDDGLQTIYGVVTLIVLLVAVGIPVAVAVLTLKPPA